MIRHDVLSLRLLLIMAGASFSPPLLAWDLPGDYFPDGTFDVFSVDQWYGKYLSSMHEPSLCKIAKRDASAEVYRVTFLPCYSPYLALKLEVHPDGTGILELKKMEQVEEASGVGYNPGRMVRKATFFVAKKEVTQFQALLQNIGFWHLPVERDLGGLGGQMFLYEGAQRGGYHVVEIPEPSHPGLISPGLFLMKLAGEREPIEHP